MVETYLLYALVFSIFLFCVETIVLLYIPYAKPKLRQIIHSVCFCGIMFSVLSYIMYVCNISLEISTLLMISATISIFVSAVFFLDKLDEIESVNYDENQEDFMTIEDFIGQKGVMLMENIESVNSNIGEADTFLHVYLGKLDNDMEIYVYSVDKMEINDIFEITSFSDGKFHCVKLNKQNNKT